MLAPGIVGLSGLLCVGSVVAFVWICWILWAIREEGGITERQPKFRLFTKTIENKGFKQSLNTTRRLVPKNYLIGPRGHCPMGQTQVAARSSLRAIFFPFSFFFNFLLKIHKSHSHTIIDHRSDFVLKLRVELKIKEDGSTEE